MREYNPNPCCIRASDCVVRAIMAATGRGWYDVYWDLCDQGAKMCDMPSVNRVWSAYLTERGYTRYEIARACSVREFARDHPYGIYVLGTGSHAVASIDGNYLDSWDSGSEKILYYFVLEN